MATRIVERDLRWCHSKLASFFHENGYHVEEIETEAKILHGKYSGAKRKGMLYRPQFRAEFSPVSPDVAQVALSFPPRIGFQTLLTVIAALIGIAPVVVLLKGFTYPTSRFDPQWQVLFGMCAIWAMLWISGVTVSTNAVVKHCKNTEGLAWRRLDPSGEVSHEVEWPTRTYYCFWHVVKWVGSVLTIVVGISMVVGVLYETMQPKGLSIYLVLEAALFLSCAFLWLFAGWLTSSWALPHRYHWKAGYGLVYMVWWLIICFPGLCLLGWSTLRSTMILRYNMGLGSASTLLVLPALFILILSYGFLIMVFNGMLRNLRARKQEAEHLAHPSTKYEEPVDESKPTVIQPLVQNYERWTLALFLFMGIIWYVNVGYLSVMIVLAGLGMFKISWALNFSSFWPIIVPAENSWMVIQTLILTSLAGLPIALTIGKYASERLSLGRKIKLARDLSVVDQELGLPLSVLTELKQKLEADKLLVCMVPTPEINLQVERIAIWKNEYLLWATVGVRKYLSSDEKEAMLLHECGHADLVTRTWWRGLVATLAPWGPRFLDLTVDLYDAERNADRYAMDKLGSAEPLISALTKVKERDKKERSSGDRNQVKAPPSEVKVLWNLGWTAYLYPEIDQRIRCLKEYR